MNDLARVTIIGGAGTFAHDFGPVWRQECDELGSNELLLGQGHLDTNRSVYLEKPDYGRGGVVNLCLEPDSIPLALGNAGSDELAEWNRPYWEPLAEQFSCRIVQLIADSGLTDGVLLWCQGLKTGQSLVAEHVLRDVHRRNPRMFIVVVSVIPEDADKRSRIHTGYDTWS